ncbi:MAG: hypothetical protein LCH51_16140, partial [Bacteroidetes bacterium]|nr:hypothetical protein [Bacteroidota bacterium]
KHELISPQSGGQFSPAKHGQFASARGGQLKPANGGQFDRRLHFGNKQSFDKVFYEKTTRIKFPEKCFVLEAFDNGEFLTGAVFDVDSMSFQNFIVTNSFDTVKSLLDVNILSKNYLTKNKPMFHSTRNLFFKRKVEQDHYWIFIADLNSKRLWTEIKYPDWSGQ